MRAAGSPMMIILHENFTPYIVDSTLTSEQESVCFESWLQSIEKAGVVTSSSQVGEILLLFVLLLLLLLLLISVNIYDD